MGGMRDDISSYNVARSDAMMSVRTITLLVGVLVVIGLLIAEMQHIAEALIVIPFLYWFWFDWRMRPQRYEIHDYYVNIVSRSRETNITLPTITEVRRIRLPGPVIPMWFRGIRWPECGILFASTGLYYVPGMGTVWMSVTNASCAVLISADRKYIISPENPDAFVADLLARGLHPGHRSRV